MNDHTAHTPNEQSSGPGGRFEPPTHHGPHGHEESPRQFFLPGRIMVHIDHPAVVDKGRIAELLDGTVQEYGFGEGLIKRVQPQNILTFPRQGDQRTFSIVPVELESARQDNLIVTLQQIYNELKTRVEPFEIGDPGEGVIWRAVSPDWLLGSATHGSSHPPSPGSWPVPPAPAVNDSTFTLVGNELNETRVLPFENGRGNNVHVAILDTAPSAVDLDEAYETWHHTNDLIDRLLQPEPNRKLRVVREIFAEIELLDCRLIGHPYWMADHGLFIAGEIESIAPDSKIHLIKVFASHGSASTRTLAQGLLHILSDPEIGRPLIVNCSFGLAAPVPGHDDPDFPVELQDPETLEHMQTSLRALFDQLTNLNEVIVVAAAGDDTKPENPPRVPARLPAAHPRVIAVGALPKDLAPGNNLYPAASYSNLVDIPNPPDVTGYMTLGGEPGEGLGVLGIFTSELPYFHPRFGEHWPGWGHLPPNPQSLTRDRFSYEANQRGEVEWAGASFATPIITGIVANWCSLPPDERADDPNEQGITVENVRAALNRMSQTGRTDANERVILVTQG